MKREKLMKTSISAPKPQSLLGIEHYRDLTNLGSLIASSPETFWCYIHLAEMPLFEQSPDPRYCKACNAVLNRDREDQGHRVTSGDRGGYHRTPKERVKTVRWKKFRDHKRCPLRKACTDIRQHRPHIR